MERHGRPSREELKQLAGSGGGCTTRFAAPTWQHGARRVRRAAGCGSARLDNDVAADGDPFTGFDIYDTYKYEPSFAGGWLTVGGTSLSSPVIAGLFALAGGSHGASYPAATLYAHLGQPSLYDVTAGGNGFCDGEAPGPCGEPELNELLGPLDCLGTTACDAAPGLDGPAGVGTPNGLVALGGASQAIPTVHTTAASSIQETGAVLNATVDPNGNEVLACSFEYGLTTAYGQSVPCSLAAGIGHEPRGGVGDARRAHAENGLPLPHRRHELGRYERGQGQETEDVLTGPRAARGHARTSHRRPSSCTDPPSIRRATVAEWGGSRCTKETSQPTCTRTRS